MTAKREHGLVTFEEARYEGFLSTAKARTRASDPASCSLILRQSLLWRRLLAYQPHPVHLETLSITRTLIRQSNLALSSFLFLLGKIWSFLGDSGQSCCKVQTWDMEEGT